MVTVLTITAIIVGSLPMSASAMIFDEAEFNNHNKAYKYDSEIDVLEVYDNVDNETLKKYKNVYCIKFVDVKLDTVSLKNCDFQYLEFERCDLTSAKIEGAENIEYVYINECRLTNLEFLAAAENVQDITLWQCELGSAKGIENMKKLYSVCFSVVGIEDVTPIAKLNNLKYLTLEYTCVSDISPLKNLNLEYLCVDDSMSIESFDSLIGMTSLEIFSARNCQMSYSREFYNFLNKNNVEHYIEENDFVIQERVKRVAKQLAKNNMTDEEKVRAVVQYVVDLMEYDFVALEDDDLLTTYNAEALKYAINGDGVCRNYSALVNALLMEMDVEVVEIRDEGHIWNIVFIEDDYFWIDATWIDDGYTTDVTESIYYCTTTYYFIDHGSLTVPASVYNDEFNTNKEEYKVEETDEEETIVEETDEEETTEEKTEKEYVETTTNVPHKMHTRLDDETEIFFESNNIDLDAEMDNVIIETSIAAIVMAVVFIAVLVKRYTVNNKRA